MILFVDYNDVCRAALAAAYYEKIHGKRAQSAGVYADVGAALGKTVCPPLIEKHTARQLTEKMVNHADKIYCVTYAIAQHLCETYPQQAYKICAMQEDIADPLGQGRQAYLDCARHIEMQMEAMQE